MLQLAEKAQQTEQEIERLVTKRKEMKYKIPIGDMPEDERYNN